MLQVIDTPEAGNTRLKGTMESSYCTYKVTRKKTQFHTNQQANAIKHETLCQLFFQLLPCELQKQKEQVTYVYTSEVEENPVSFKIESSNKDTLLNRSQSCSAKVKVYP